MSADALYCRTELNFAAEDQAVPVAVDIRDGRQALAELDYERCGFTLLNHGSAVSDWRSEDELLRVHIAEIAQLAREFSGCDKAVVYQPLIRSPETAVSHADYAPIETVHSDFTADYRAMVCEPDRPYRTFLDPMLARAGVSRDDVVAAKRILMLQFWRNIGATWPDRPFALCDASTVPSSELYSILVPEYGGEKLAFETFIGTVPDKPGSQHWYTFPGLGIDEVIAFRTYDSRCDDQGRAFWTPHSAFLDPNVGADAAQRESLEMRVLCLFDD
jgi:hypothetical protein